MEPAKNTETYANDSATSSSIDTELAQPCSRDVLDLIRRQMDDLQQLLVEQ